MIARTKTFNHSLIRCFVQSLPRNLGRVALTALFLIPTLRASSPNDLPSLGDSSSRIVSPQMEQQIGEIFLKQLHAALPLSKDVLIQYYVEQLGAARWLEMGLIVALNGEVCQLQSIPMQGDEIALLPPVSGG